MSLNDDVDLEEFIMAKDDLSGADIKAVCTEAGMLALRERRMRVTKADFTAAREKVSWMFELRVMLLSRRRFCTGRTKALPKACICSLSLSIINIHFPTLSSDWSPAFLQGDSFICESFCPRPRFDLPMWSPLYLTEHIRHRRYCQSGWELQSGRTSLTLISQNLQSVVLKTYIIFHWQSCSSESALPLCIFRS